MMLRSRTVLLLVLVTLPLPVMLWLGPIAQSPDYHAFADRRTFFGIVNFFDVASNIAFLLVGCAGLNAMTGIPASASRAAWTTLFAGVALVGFGSSWYHWHPENDTLLWDRLPISIGFAGFCAALYSEYLDERTGRYLPVPFAAASMSAVWYWYASGDLSLYLWVQMIPLLAVPVLLSCFEPRCTHQWMLAAAVACQVASRLFEFLDHEMFAWTGQWVGGHTLKHLAAALGCWLLLVMLKRRRPVNGTKVSPV